MSSGSAEPRDILDAAEEGEAMIVGERDGRALRWGGLVVKGSTRMGSNDGLSHAESRLDDCDKTPPLLSPYKTSSNASDFF